MIISTFEVFKFRVFYISMLIAMALIAKNSLNSCKE